MEIEIELIFEENSEHKSYKFSSYAQLGIFITACDFKEIKILDVIVMEG